MSHTGHACNRRILIVDACEEIHRLFRRILIADGGANGRGEDACEAAGRALPSAGVEKFEVESATRGEEALSRVRKAVGERHPYAVAFVDHQIQPGCSGIEMAARLWEACPELEIVLCAEHSDESWERLTEKLDHTDHLMILKKPFDEIEVRQLAHALIEKWNLQHGGSHARQDTEPAARGGAKARVVVVDDDASMLALLEKLLKNAGYEVHCFADSGEAWNALSSEEPTILLTDWRMPGLSGVELCRRIRSSDHLGKIYSILVTATEHSDDLVVAMEAGADDFVCKPCNKQELLARVRAGNRVLRLLQQQRGYAAIMEEHNRALEEANRQAEEAVAALQHTQRQLLQADKMASIGQLAAGVAHEINNPIGFISSNLNSLGQYVEDLKSVFTAHEDLLRACAQHAPLADQVAEVQRIREERDIEYVLSDLESLIGESIEGARRVRKIVADLRDFSHVDNPDIGEENLNDLLEKTINVAWNELKYKTEVIREYGEIPALACYGGKLGQVFLNLLVNAAHAIEERGTITVRTRQEGEAIVIEVSDTGCGIAPENLDRIFEPFFTTKEVGKGTGLGLHLAYNIVQAHGGQIRVESTVGEGTTFRIELPLSGPPEAQEQKRECVA